MGHSNAKYRTQDYWQNMPAHAEWFIDACGHAGGDVTYTSGSGFHANSDDDDNGVDSTHSDINGTGRGGIRHYSDHTRIYWGIRRHGNTATDLESQNAADFYSAMRSTGTLFRWRDDPDQTVYRVLDSIGHRNAANYQHESNSYPGSKKRRQMVQRIVVDATNLPMDPVNWDPMSACRHDGHGDATIIDIVTPDVTFGMDSS